MKQGGGKQKGAAFERLVAKQLSLWLSDGKRDDLMWRSAMSGGRATIGFRTGNVRINQSGDLSPIDVDAMKFSEMFSVEIKFYKQLHIERLIYGGRGGITAFWDQACEDAEKVGKYPLLIAKENFHDVLVASKPPAFYPLFENGIHDPCHILVPGLHMELFTFDYFLTHAVLR